MYLLFYLEKCDKENAERTITQATDSCFSRGEMQDQPVWGNCSDDELIQSEYLWRKIRVIWVYGCDNMLSVNYSIILSWKSINQQSFSVNIFMNILKCRAETK